MHRTQQGEPRTCTCYALYYIYYIFVECPKERMFFFWDPFPYSYCTVYFSNTFTAVLLRFHFAGNDRPMGQLLDSSRCPFVFGSFIRNDENAAFSHFVNRTGLLGLTQNTGCHRRIMEKYRRAAGQMPWLYFVLTIIRDLCTTLHWDEMYDNQNPNIRDRVSFSCHFEFVGGYLGFLRFVSFDRWSSPHQKISAPQTVQMFPCLGSIALRI